jgi:hypothetical protein
MRNVRPEPREWRPNWAPEDLAEIDRIKAELRSSKPLVRAASRLKRIVDPHSF